MAACRRYPPAGPRVIESVTSCKPSAIASLLQSDRSCSSSGTIPHPVPTARGAARRCCTGSAFHSLRMVVVIGAGWGEGKGNSCARPTLERMGLHAKRLECVQLAGAVLGGGGSKAGASSTHSKRFAQFGCGVAALRPSRVCSSIGLASKRSGRSGRRVTGDDVRHTTSLMTSSLRLAISSRGSSVLPEL